MGYFVTNTASALATGFWVLVGCSVVLYVGIHRKQVLGKSAPILIGVIAVLSAIGSLFPIVDGNVDAFLVYICLSYAATNMALILLNTNDSAK